MIFVSKNVIYKNPGAPARFLEKKRLLAIVPLSFKNKAIELRKPMIAC
jgi:hypothetical protein